MEFDIIMTEVISNYPETSVIVISERDNLDGAIEALNTGAWDIVESVTSHRPYRVSLGIDKALQIIESEKDVYLDAKVVNVCAKLFREKGDSTPEFM